MSEADDIRAEVRSTLRGGLAGIAAAQEAAVAPILAGRQAEGAAAVRGVLLAWGGLLRAVPQVLPALPDEEARRVVDRLGPTREWLQELQGALGAGKWVETADLLSIEGRDLLDRWEASLDGPAHPTGGDSREAARSP